MPRQAGTLALQKTFDRPPLQQNIFIVTPPYHQILGIRFFAGTAQEAIERICASGGFLVAPSAPGMVRLCEDEPYRRAMVAAGLAIPDSGLMVLIWRLLRREEIRRVSGLKYLKQLLAKLKGEATPEISWVLPGERAREKLLDWSRRETFPVKIDNCYLAPHYGLEIEDRHLLAHLEQRHPAHVLIAIGSGPQEKLAHYIIERLSYRPAVHCVGAALGFITGDQISIPDWADRFYLGWFLRFLGQPRVFIPRLARGFELPWLIWKYGENLPPIRQGIARPVDSMSG